MNRKQREHVIILISLCMRRNMQIMLQARLAACVRTTCMQIIQWGKQHLSTPETATTSNASTYIYIYSRTHLCVLYSANCVFLLIHMSCTRLFCLRLLIFYFSICILTSSFVPSPLLRHSPLFPHGRSQCYFSPHNISLPLFFVFRSVKYPLFLSSS